MCGSMCTTVSQPHLLCAKHVKGWEALDLWPLPGVGHFPESDVELADVYSKASLPCSNRRWNAAASWPRLAHDSSGTGFCLRGRKRRKNQIKTEERLKECSYIEYTYWIKKHWLIWRNTENCHKCTIPTQTQHLCADIVTQPVAAVACDTQEEQQMSVMCGCHVHGQSNLKAPAVPQQISFICRWTGFLY